MHKNAQLDCSFLGSERVDQDRSPDGARRTAAPIAQAVWRNALEGPSKYPQKLEFPSGHEPIELSLTVYLPVFAVKINIVEHDLSMYNHTLILPVTR